MGRFEFESPKVIEILILNQDRSISFSTKYLRVLCILSQSRLARLLIERSWSKLKFWVTLGTTYQVYFFYFFCHQPGLFLSYHPALNYIRSGNTFRKTARYKNPSTASIKSSVPLMANESHKEFLFLIRDFSNQKTHGGTNPLLYLPDWLLNYFPFILLCCSPTSVDCLWIESCYYEKLFYALVMTNSFRLL